MAPALTAMLLVITVGIGASCSSREEREPAPATAVPPSGGEPSGDTPATSPADPNAPPPAAGDIPRNCAFRAGQRCFDTADEACTAAGCPRDQCAILESYPAQVQCQPRGP